MSQYIDGFVIPVSKDKIDAYREMAERAAAIWIEHGALEYRECLGDDLDFDFGVPFTRLANCGPDETVFFSWVVYASKEARDEANAKIHADPRLKEMCDPDHMPFDCKRMSFGGFRSVVSA